MQRQSVQKYLGLFLDEKLSLHNIDEIMEKSYTQTESLTTTFVVASSL